MAADDIYKIDCQMEAPSGAASFGVYYQETVPRDGAENDNFAISDAFSTDVVPTLLACIGDDWKLAAIESNKLVINPVEKWRVDDAVQVGDIAGPSLPANNAAVFTLHQSTFGARSDGRIFIPGIPESVTLVGVLTAAHLAGVLNTFAQALIDTLVQTSGGTGRWELGVISAKVRDAALPFKDWDGAFAPVTSITRNPIIGTQRRRQTKVRGRSI